MALLHSHISARATAALLPGLGQHRMPRYQALAGSLVELILDGRIAPGTRLPSERDLAGQLQVSRATVTSAYDVLRAQRYLTSRTGSGSVAVLPNRAAGKSLFSTTSAEMPADVFDLSRATMPAPADHLASAVAAAAVELPGHAERDGYEAFGLDGLRRAIAARFEHRGLPTAPEQVLVTNGAMHAIGLLLRLLTGSGDRVLTDLPTYSGLLDVVRASSTRLVPVPLAAGGGWDVAALTTALRQSAPRLAVLIPDFHNPTGALMPVEQRAQVLRAAQRSGTTVVVDESFVELGLSAPAPAPTAALDRSVLTVGSLSKPFWAGLRIGWIRAPKEMVSRLAAARAVVDIGSPTIEQLIATHVVTGLDDIAAERCAQLRPRRDALLTALSAKLPGWRPRVPVGGMSMWVELDAPLATALATTAGGYGVRVVPGARFAVAGTMERFLRLPFTLPPAELAAAVDALAHAWQALDPAAAVPPPLIVA